MSDDFDRITAAYGSTAISTGNNVRSIMLGQLFRQTYYVPKVQRDFVWSDDQVLAFHRRIFGEGKPFGMITTIESHDGKTWVLDGQQRLTAIGATLFREDGTEQVAERLPTWDLLNGGWSWHPVDREHRTLRGLCDRLTEFAGPVAAGFALSQSLAKCIFIHQSEIKTRGTRDHIDNKLDYQPEDLTQIVRDTFEALNSGGTPMSDAELQSLLRRITV